MIDQKLAESLVVGWELVRSASTWEEYRTPGPFGSRYRVVHRDATGAIVTVTEKGKRLIEPE